MAAVEGRVFASATDSGDAEPIGRLRRMHDLPDEILDALGFLRANLSGLIRFDTEYLPIRVVIAPDGRLVAPVMESMLLSTDCAIYLPEEPTGDDDAVIQLMVTLERFQESGPEGRLADRWRIYHGDPEDVRWATMSIDFCKFGEYAFDGAALLQPNPLAGDEPAICRAFNPTREDDLRRVALQVAEVELEAPRLVGVDPLGFDVRGRFRIARIPAPTPFTSAEEAIAAFDAMLADAD